MFPQNPNSRMPMRSRIIAVILLGVFVLGCSGLFPLALTALAYVDGDHGVVASCDDGRFRLVLTHDKTEAVGHNVTSCRSSGHQHGLSAKLLCTLAASRGLDPDHFLELSTGFVSELDDDDPLGEALHAGWVSERSADHIAAISSFELWARNDAERFRHRPPTSANSPPPQFDFLSTVLLI